MEPVNNSKTKKAITASMAFIVLMAIVSMFSDIVHEGANSMNGSFEKFLGAPTMVVSVVGGCATLLGCSLRMLFGYLADKTKHYWVYTIIGYAVDLVAVPLLALVPNESGGWIWAVAFILLEKIGKAVKKPAKDSLVSFAATQNGIGKSFAFGELLDQIGAFIGPVILTVTYLIKGDLTQYQKYTIGFAVLGIPAVICMVILIIAFFRFPHPDQFEKDTPEGDTKGLAKKKTFVLFLIASALLAFGFMDSFSLINQHMAFLNIVSQDYLPLMYSYAMIIDALAAVGFGILFDKKGFLSIVIATLMTASYSFFIFYLGSLWSMFIGLTLWGIGMGAEESVMKSGITLLSPKESRAKAFGFYELFYGIAAFAGSFLLGWLYDASKIALCLVSCLFVVAAAVVYFFSGKTAQNGFMGKKDPGESKPEPSMPKQ
jgi:MFS family permease